MPYDRFLEVPKVNFNEKGCEVTHNHANSYKFRYAGSTPTKEEKKLVRTFFKEAKNEIKKCKSFLEETLGDKQLSGIQKATLKQFIKNDEELIDKLDQVTPSCCVIC